MSQESAQHFGIYIKKLREERKLSLREAAAKAGMNSGTLSRLETGQRRPQPKTLKALAGGLDVPLVDLFAAAGYMVYDLPSMNAFLRATHGDLPEKTLTEIDNYLTKVINEHGLEPYGPVDREDELLEPTQQ